MLNDPRRSVAASMASRGLRFVYRRSSMYPAIITVLRAMLLLLLALLLPAYSADAGYVWSLRGTNDIIQRTERDLTQSGDPITKQRWYVTDLDSSVVATVSQTGAIVERVSYTPFGEVRHHPPSDLNGDGKVDFNDQLLLVGNWGNSGLGDINQDGVVNLADQLILQAQFTSGLAPGGLSTDGNTIGFTAHIYDVESGLLLARFRVYDASLGRWLSPDPAGFVDGMNLYLYVRGNPLLWWDPLGLSAFRNWWRNLREGAVAFVTGDTGVSGWQANDRATLERHRALAQSDDPATRAAAERMIASVEQGLSEVGDAVTDFQQARVDAAVTIVAAPLTGTAALAVHTAHACGNAAVDIWQGQYGNAALSIVPGAAGSAAAPAMRHLAPGSVMAMFRRAGRQADEVAGGARATPLTSPVANLRAAGSKDAHHVIQDASVRDLSGYSTHAAPGVQLRGPSTAVGTPHYLATQVQRQAGGGTYAAERRIGYKALRRGGYSQTDARQVIAETDTWFRSIGVLPTTPTRVPGNR